MKWTSHRVNTTKWILSCFFFVYLSFCLGRRLCQDPTTTEQLTCALRNRNTIISISASHLNSQTAQWPPHGRESMRLWRVECCLLRFSCFLVYYYMYSMLLLYRFIMVTNTICNISALFSRITTGPKCLHEVSETLIKNTDIHILTDILLTYIFLFAVIPQVVNKYLWQI